MDIYVILQSKVKHSILILVITLIIKILVMYTYLSLSLSLNLSLCYLSSQSVFLSVHLSVILCVSLSFVKV